MKLIIIFVCISVLGLLCAPSRAEIIVVSVTHKAGTRFKAKKGAEALAKKEAIRKYIKRINSSADPKVIEELASGYPKFVESVIQEEFSFQKGLVSASYSVEIDDERLNREAEKLGIPVQTRLIQLVILEEPPSRAHIQLQEADFGLAEFVSHYTDFQRRIRDAVIRKANQQGLKIKLLSDMRRFEPFKTKDRTLLGVYYDPDLSEFKIDTGLIRKIRKDLPGTIAIYYRINSLYFTRKDRILKANISISLKKFDTNETKSLGSQGYAVKVAGYGYDAILDGFGTVAENATALLMNKANQKLNDLIMEASNRPTNVTIRLPSNRTLYRLKREISKRTKIMNVRVQDGILTFQVDAKIPPEEFVYESLFDAFEGIGLSIRDEDVSINGREVQVSRQ